MNTAYKNVIILSTIIGILFQFVTQLKSIGVLLIFLVLPVLLVFTLLSYKSKFVQENKKVSGAFLLTITITTISIVLYVIMRILHLPGNSEMMVISSIFSIISLIVGTVYIRKNSNVIGAELALMFIPIVMIVWHIIPVNAPPQLKYNYPSLISSYSLNQELASDLLDNNCPETSEINEIIEELITSSGGLDENRIMIGFYNTQLLSENRELITSLIEKNKLSYSNFNVIRNINYLGELVFALNQMKNEIIIKNCR